MFKNELRKESFFNDLESTLEDIRLLLKDYDFDIDYCLEDEENCEIEDEDILQVATFYIHMIKSLNRK